MSKKTKKPWPTKDAMNQIHQLNLWSGKDEVFYSGAGSHDDHIVKPYLEGVIAFLKVHNNGLTVCDLGCRGLI